MSIRKLTVCPQGGLGNRIRVMNSAYEFARINGLRLNILWIQDWGLKCSYDELFMRTELHDVREVSKLASYFFKTVNFLLKKIVPLRGIASKMFGYEYEISSILHITKPRANRFVWTCHRFFDYSSNYLKFNSRIEREAQSFFEDIYDSVYGIHIRMTDNSNAKALSPPKLFEEKMTSLLLQNPNCKFLVCTDDLTVKKELKIKFPNSVITRDVPLERDSAKGIINAAIDMACLSRTDMIYCSFYSSFSEVASEIGNIDRIVLKM